MCGIIGITGTRNVTPLILETLHRLEYRGYDSAGIATVCDHVIHLRRKEGKLKQLEALLKKEPMPHHSHCGIGHTRWATHGRPTTTNAHPHSTDNVAVVHNGIIENFLELKEHMTHNGSHFQTETDSEVIAHIIDHHLQQNLSPLDATRKTLTQLEGAFAIVIIFRQFDNLLIGARLGSPLAIGFGDGEMYLSSDAIALAPFTQRLCYLEEGDHVTITPDTWHIYDHHNKKQQRPIKQTATSGATIGKGDFPHFMLKEIYEQPAVVGETLESFINPLTRTIAMPAKTGDLSHIQRMHIIACGTSYYAGLVARYMLERTGHIMTQCDVASEFRYRSPVLCEGDACVFISQSGETADTLEAMKLVKAHHPSIPRIALVNVEESSIARMADHVLLTHAGPEIGVASTKAFTTQLALLACWTIGLAKQRRHITTQEEQQLARALIEIPTLMSDVLAHERQIRAIITQHHITKASSVMYLGRDDTYPIALEGALKLKEIAYIHTQAYAAGEMKHGPIALIDENMPVIVLAPDSAVLRKTLSNVAEIVSRGGNIILFATKKTIDTSGLPPHSCFAMPDAHAFTNPLLYALPVQLLAYHTASMLGTDVDQPRNLAKAVTVE
ncbi:MAG: glutamine--fructose-6-phosphate transaminase (isomerizing) [Alphaproteobacteria bacterium GM7ARS4]|nr:glutamine--fructose-6-phosphate transaminase (isomerizing) [Alphaproteobacteria bacterium GM7ARS4]